MENQTVTHIQQNQRYKVILERAASTKGVDGFKVEANGDDLQTTFAEAQSLYEYSRRLTTPIAPAGA